MLNSGGPSHQSEANLASDALSLQRGSRVRRVPLGGTYQANFTGANAKALATVSLACWKRAPRVLRLAADVCATCGYREPLPSRIEAKHPTYSRCRNLSSPRGHERQTSGFSFMGYLFGKESLHFAQSACSGRLFDEALT